MTITVSEEIHAPRERVWHVVTDIDSWTETISAIEAVEVLERPEHGVIGLKWRETRVLFGKEAVETMWISSAEPGQWYETTAHNHGMLYNTRVILTEHNGHIVLTMAFAATPESLGAKLMYPVSLLFNGALRKMLKKDLADIRQVAEDDSLAI